MVGGARRRWRARAWAVVALAATVAVSAALLAPVAVAGLVAAVAASAWGTGESAVRRLQLDSR